LIEVHVVTAENSLAYAAELESYHRWRHLIYVEERGRAELRKPDGLERDQFDTPQAIHLLALENGRVVGGSRLMRASRPTILSEIFPHLVERSELPRDDATLDWTRMFVVPSHRGAGKPRSVRGALFTSVMQYALSANARRLGGVMEAFRLSQFAAVGWRMQILCLPRPIAGAMVLAAFVAVDDEALRSVRASTGWAESLLRYEPDRRHEVRT
jgi:acyl-homoserine lactone synthase